MSLQSQIQAGFDAIIAKLNNLSAAGSGGPSTRVIEVGTGIGAFTTDASYWWHASDKVSNANGGTATDPTQVNLYQSEGTTQKALLPGETIKELLVVFGPNGKANTHAELESWDFSAGVLGLDAQDTTGQYAYTEIVRENTVYSGHSNQWRALVYNFEPNPAHSPYTEIKRLAFFIRGNPTTSFSSNPQYDFRVYAVINTAG